MAATRAGFVQAILEDPDDDTSRLIYADWLEEQGEAKYARFIRAQVQLARVPEYDPLWVRYRFLDWTIIFGGDFEKDRPEIPGGIRWEMWSFDRGFPARIEVQEVETFVTRAPALFAVAPVQSLKVHSAFRAPPPNIAALCDSPHLGRLRELKFSLSRLPAAEIQRLQESPHAANLTSLEFEFAGIDPNAVATLFRPPLITRLTRLRLHSNDIGWVRLADALQGAGGPGRLRSLTLSETIRTRLHRSDVFGAPLVKGLAELDLSGNELGPTGVRLLAEALVGSGLESLNLSGAVPGVPGIQALAGCAALSGLRRLVLKKNALGPVAIKHLAQSPHLANLRVLDLTNNPLGDKGAQALAESPHLRNLLHLELMRCEIGDAGAQALLNSPVTAGLVRLAVSGHSRKVELSDAMKQKLKEYYRRGVLD